ncbi:hypothetical protein [Candidatus Poriferisodalis sp.]|uniref:hypothetical protein n=1 Tax=Candidatus Poriferisodalis sp. TaxID=3101277 RepID=UPI003D118FAE
MSAIGCDTRRPAFVRFWDGTEESVYGNGWVDIQPGRFSYSTDDGRVRMIFGDYLYADVLMYDWLSALMAKAINADSRVVRA